MKNKLSDDIFFGEWVRQRRHILDLTQQELADRVGYARITLRRIEAGTLKPSKGLAEILLKELGEPSTDPEAWLRFARGTSGLPNQSNSGSKEPTSNLPFQLSSFVGRSKELKEIASLIFSNRLTTLVGPGGVGKTRLALKIGEQVLGDYAHGVWFVELAPIADPLLVPRTIAIAIGLRDEPQRQVIDMLSDYLRGKKILIILDNCEHVLNACAQLADRLLKQCANLRILATSREALGIIGEAVYQVPSLQLPDMRQLLEDFRHYESVHLFEERAQLTRMDFALTIENATSVAQICHRLDGIPLAIELAAAHISIFSVEQMATQLNDGFSLLTGGSRTALPRQQTLRASVEWSWNLLSESEQTLMQQLSVFAGGWTLDSAQAVYEGDALNLISTLVKKSLIMVDQESGHETRYHFHEIIRQYGHEKLVTASEEYKIRTRHLKYFLQFSEQAESALRGPAQVEWHARLNDERDNVRTALEWADKTDVEAGLYLSGRLHDFWESLDLREGALWLDKFIQKPESKTYLGARAKALYVHGDLLCDFQQFVQARSLMQESLDLYRASNNKPGEVFALLSLSSIVNDLGHGEQSMELAEQALALAQPLGDIWSQAKVLSKLGRLKPPDPKRRISYWEEVIDMFRKAGDWHALADHLGNLGLDLVLDGDIETAQKYLAESTSLLQRLNNKVQWTPAKVAYSQIALMHGDYEQARTLLQELILIAEELGGQQSYLEMRVRLGYVALREGNLTEARHIFAETAQNFQKDKSEIGVVFTLEGVASLSVAVSKPEHAVRLMGWADATREKIADHRPLLEQADVDKIIAACLAKMGEVAFSDAYDEGQKMSLDEAVAYALKED